MYRWCFLIVNYEGFYAYVLCVHEHFYMHVQAKYDIWLTKCIYEKGAHGGVCIYIYVCVCVYL